MAENLKSNKATVELDAAGLRFAIVVSRFNSLITERLLAGAMDALQRSGAAKDGCRSGLLCRELLSCRWRRRNLRTRGEYDALIAIGCVIRGETSHYDYVCSETARGLQLAQMDTGVPIIFCVLTCETQEQAMARAGGEARE